MNIEDAEELTAHLFQLEQELARGTWDEKEEAMKLIEFAKNFDKNVKQNRKLEYWGENHNG